MRSSESRELTRCVLCGAEIAPGRDRTFAISPEQFLCFACAVRRGGSWDERRDRWTEEPELGGLPRGED
ncbi:MAG: hypothetical protein OZ948_07570 [Deltaproteobacteria bacterium]|nr:hypothetical protein [Deltaproteobacteria bacterium]